MSNSEDLSDSTTSLYDGSSGNEADSERESHGKDLREITELMNCFNPYMFEPKKKDVSSTGSSSESESEKIESERQNETRVTNLGGCTCGNCKNKKREIDCLCCQDVDALNGIFHNEQVKCAVMCEEFKTLFKQGCIEKCFNWTERNKRRSY